MSAGEMPQCIQLLQPLRSRRKKFISLMISLTTMYPLHTARQGISSDWIISVTAIPRIISIGKDTPVSSFCTKAYSLLNLWPRYIKVVRHQQNDETRRLGRREELNGHGDYLYPHRDVIWFRRCVVCGERRSGSQPTWLVIFFSLYILV